MNVDYYKGLKGIYFKKIIKEIITIANLNDNKKIILDYGCGVKFLEKTLGRKILNFDINPKYSELKNFTNLQFDVVIFNHILMYMSEDEINKTLNSIRLLNNSCFVVVGIGRMTIINKFASWLSLNFSAHRGTKTKPKRQLDILLDHFDLISKNSIFAMTDIYYLKFK